MDGYWIAMRRYASFSGRSQRREYWWFFAMVLLISLIVGAVFGIAGRHSADLAGAVMTLVHLVPSLAAAARRLHDAGFSGWWQLLMLIPVVGFVALMVLLALPSQPGTNRFGTPAQPIDDLDPV